MNQSFSDYLSGESWGKVRLWEFSLFHFVIDVRCPNGRNRLRSAPIAMSFAELVLCLPG
jgi:hypothetical protein